MNTYRFKLTNHLQNCKWEFRGLEFRAKSRKAAWKKAMREWRKEAEKQRNSSVGCSSSFCGGEFEAELVEVHRREQVTI
jgi:hypothetical protein